MIHPLREEIYVAIYLIIYGIYLISTYDLFLYYSNRLIKKKIIKIVLEIIFCIIQLIVTYLFSYNLASGYIPIYFVLFIIVGVYFYIIFFKNNFKIVLSKLLQIINKHSSHIKMCFSSLLYSRTLFKRIKTFLKRLNTIASKTISESIHINKIS